MPQKSITISLPPGESIRIDAWVSGSGILTRGQIKSRDLRVSDDSGPVKLSRKVRDGETYKLEWDDPEPLAAGGEEIPLSILYEDSEVIVLDKPQGLVVHPGCGNRSGTLVNGLIHYVDDLKEEFGDEIRPGIVHRLDRDTSGVIVAVKTLQALEFLARQFHDRHAKKEYIAIVKGRPLPGEGEIDTFIARDQSDRKRFAVHSSAGKRSVTRYRVEKVFDGYSLVRLFPLTGRTHQLRVHMKHLGHPIVGDPVYSRRDSRFPEATLMLHAEILRIVLPSDGIQHEFRAPVPQRFGEMLSILSRTDSPRQASS